VPPELEPGLRNNHAQSGNSPPGLLANTATENSNQVSSSTSAITKQEPSRIYYGWRTAC